MSAKPSTPAIPVPQSPVAESALQELVVKIGGELNRAMLDGFKTTNANIDLLQNQFKHLESRQDAIETTVHDLASWRKNNSDRVRGIVHAATSEADLKVEAQLAEEITARKDLAVQVKDIGVDVTALNSKQDQQLAILARLDKIASNPKVKTIAAILATAFITWASTHHGSGDALFNFFAK